MRRLSAPASRRARSEPPRSSRFEDPDQSELVLGIVAGVGTPLERVQSALAAALRALGYRSELVHLSRLTKGFAGLRTPSPRTSAGEAARITAMMNRGDEARQTTGRDDILALAAISDIRARRGAGATPFPSTAFILRQLKRPEEVFRLRKTYGDGFHLIGAYCPRTIRERQLRSRRVSRAEINALIDRDEHEPSVSGQKLRDTFHLADVFIDASNARRAREGVQRFLDLLFGVGIRTPSQDEFGMYQAFANSLRSSQLGRQVGAAILGVHGELLAVGVNEVPRRDGGVYWEGDALDQRDHRRGEDSSDKLRLEMVWEISERLTPNWEQLTGAQKRQRVYENMEKLRSTTVTHLTEFGRAVHAEAEAILSAARTGISIRGSRLYCTTFPCHVCAKHIVGAGLSRVTFIEPYPKSKALTLHDDSIVLEKDDRKRVVFQPFVGVAPRRFADLFAMTSTDGAEVRRKDSQGRPILARKGLRLRMPYLSALDREKWAAAELLAYSRPPER
jgi:deoxycytidylate deaminase